MYFISRTFLNIKGFSQIISSYNKLQKLLPAKPRQNFKLSNIDLQKIHNLLIFWGGIKGYRISITPCIYFDIL